jgi:hypothetical protein
MSWFQTIWRTLGVLIVLSLIVMLFAGCGQMDRNFATLMGQPSETCVSGVTYLQFTSGATVKVDQEGKPFKCN